MQNKKLKPKKCAFKLCGKEFAPFNGFQKTCNKPACAVGFVRQKAEEKSKRKTNARRKDFLNNDRSHWRKKAQTIFNKYIRLRDAGVGCISCGKENGKFDAGHYRSVGAHPELRFEPLNNHKQCVKCNQHLSGNLIDYRINLINKIGLNKVEWIEGSHRPKNYSLDDFKAIYKDYFEKCKELEKING